MNPLIFWMIFMYTCLIPFLHQGFTDWPSHGYHDDSWNVVPQSSNLPKMETSIMPHPNWWRNRFLDNPLVNVYITMENHYVSWENSLFLWPFSNIFNSYVSLPEGMIRIQNWGITKSLHAAKPETVDKGWEKKEQNKFVWWFHSPRTILVKFRLLFHTWMEHHINKNVYHIVSNHQIYQIRTTATPNSFGETLEDAAAMHQESLSLFGQVDSWRTTCATVQQSILTVMYSI